MRRRAFITLFGGAAAAWPLAARAQQTSVPKVGFLAPASEEGFASQIAAFRGGLEQTGFREHQNIDIEYRLVEGRLDQMPDLAADLVRRRVAAIVPVGNAVFAVKAATSTIPIVFVASMDPAAMGVVASLNHPGGNITGVTTLNVDVESKRLELLHELLPGMSRVAFLVNPTNPNLVVYTQDAQAAARSLGLELHVVMAGSERDFGPAFDALDAQKVGVLSLMALRVISRRRGISLVFRAKRT